MKTREEEVAKMFKEIEREKSKKKSVMQALNFKLQHTRE